MKVLDPGHEYLLLRLDETLKDSLSSTLTFVKRHDPVHPHLYPGNTDSYPGTNLQSVLRCLTERIRYLQKQHSCMENRLILFFLRACLWLLEFRAARRHGTTYRHGFHFAEFAPMCRVCGHTQCVHLENTP